MATREGSDRRRINVYISRSAHDRLLILSGGAKGMAAWIEAQVEKETRERAVVTQDVALLHLQAIAQAIDDALEELGKFKISS